jgi:hypothetical protein
MRDIEFSSFFRAVRENADDGSVPCVGFRVILCPLRVNSSLRPNVELEDLDV